MKLLAVIVVGIIILNIVWALIIVSRRDRKRKAQQRIDKSRERVMNLFDEIERERARRKFL